MGYFKKRRYTSMDISYNPNHKHGMDQPPVNACDLIGVPKHVVVVASSAIKASQPDEITTTTPVASVNLHRIFRGGTIRVTVKAKRVDGAYAGNLKFRVNGAEIAEYITFSTAEYYTKTEDLDVAKGDRIDLLAYNLYTKDFTIGFDRKLYE